MSRYAPRTISSALADLNAQIAPASTLARVQEVWSSAAGATIAAAARPTAERDGVLTLICDGAAWAQELNMMAGDIIPRINAALGREAIRELRCRTA